MLIDSTITIVIVDRLIVWQAERRIRVKNCSSPRMWADEDVSEKRLASVVNSVMERAQLDESPTDWTNLDSIDSTWILPKNKESLGRLVDED